MGTRSLTHIKTGDADSATLATIYRQYDGYPSVHGEDLAGILNSLTMVNGIGGKSSGLKRANGMGCAACQIIDELKGGEAGNVYLNTPDSQNVGEEYTYTVWLQDGALWMDCGSFGDAGFLFKGPAADFDSGGLD